MGLDMIIDPRHNVVLESSFDELMQNIRREHVMYISMGKIGRKWLDMSN